MARSFATTSAPHDSSTSTYTEQVVLFLNAWEEAFDAYQHLVSEGVSRDDHELAVDQQYARLLQAGQRIHWIGGQAAVKTAARTLGKSIPDGTPSHFDRLWCGLLP